MDNLSRGELRIHEARRKQVETPYGALDLNALSSLHINEVLDGQIQTKYQEDARRVEYFGIVVGDRVYLKTAAEEHCGFYVGTCDAYTSARLEKERQQYVMDAGGLVLLLNTKPIIEQGDTGSRVFVRAIKELRKLD